MNIFFLINTLRSGGAQQALTSILENFKKENLNVYLIVIDRKNKIDSTISNDNLNVIYLNSSTKKPFNVLKNLFYLTNRHKPKYIIATGNSEIIIFSRLICFLKKIKNISWIQFDYENSVPRSIYKKIIWILFFKKFSFIDNKIVLISNYLKKRYISDLGWDIKKISIIPNTFSRDYINLFKNKKVKNKIILCPGRLDYDKNHLEIIKALNVFKNKYDNFKCLFIGEKGNAYKDIKESIQFNKLEKNIKIEKFSNSKKFLQKLNSSFLVILASKKEPFGVIALETIFLKKNFIISNSTGFKDIIKGIKARNIIHNYKNSEEIYKKIMSLYSKPLKQTEKEIFYERIIKNFESKTVFKKWKKIIV